MWAFSRSNANMPIEEKGPPGRGAASPRSGLRVLAGKANRAFFRGWAETIKQGLSGGGSSKREGEAPGSEPLSRGAAAGWGLPLWAGGRESKSYRLGGKVTATTSAVGHNRSSPRAAARCLCLSHLEARAQQDRPRRERKRSLCPEPHWGKHSDRVRWTKQGAVFGAAV